MTGLTDRVLGHIADVMTENLRSKSGNVNVASSSSAVDAATLETALPPGTWIIFLQASFANNSNGTRAVAIRTTVDGVIQPSAANTRFPASASVAAISVSTVVRIAKPAVVIFRGGQSSGSTLSCSYQYLAVRLA